MLALMSSSDFGERDTVAVKAAGQCFFLCGWLEGMKERAKAPGAGWASVPRGVFDYQASKRLTFTDSFPLCALSIPHS